MPDPLPLAVERRLPLRLRQADLRVLRSGVRGERVLYARVGLASTQRLAVRLPFSMWFIPREGGTGILNAAKRFRPARWTLRMTYLIAFCHGATPRTDWDW